MSAKGYRLSPEQRARIAEGVRRRYADAEYAARQREGVHRHWSQPEARQGASETMRENWQRPEYRNPTLAAFAERPKTFDKNAYDLAYAKAHPDKRLVFRHRRRARLLGRFVEDVDRRELLLRHRGICGWCDQPVDPANFHVDHIVALVLGGEHSYANTQPTHPECNIAKRVALKERAA